MQQKGIASILLVVVIAVVLVSTVTYLWVTGVVQTPEFLKKLSSPLIEEAEKLGETEGLQTQQATETLEGGGEISEDEVEKQSEDQQGVKTFHFEEFGSELEADVKWTSEDLRVSGDFVDSEVFQLPDGSYALHLGGFGKVAYSQDGLTWSISGDSAIGEAPSILKLPDGGYRAWWSVPKGAETFDMLTAFSSDGYNWGNETKLMSSNMEDFYGALPAVVISPDGTYRMYYTRTGPDTFIKSDLPGVELHIKRIHSAHSSDGLAWEPDPGIRIDGGEEADKGHSSSNDVYIREDGKYEMVYNSGNYGIGIAVSDDGLDWTRLGSTGMDGADPVVNVFSDGTVRMYYAVYIPESKKQDFVGLDIQAGIYSAVREPILE